MTQNSTSAKAVDQMTRLTAAGALWKGGIAPAITLFVSALGWLLHETSSSAQEVDKPARTLQIKQVPDDVWSAVISRDGKVLTAGAGWWDQPGEIGVWDLATREPLQRFAEGRGVASVALSSDGKLLASGSWTGNVKLYDWAAGKELAVFEGVGVSRVAFSPNDELLASAAESKKLQLWDVPRRKHLADLQGELMRFHCVMFSPDGKLLLAGGGDWKPGGVNQVVIWHVASQTQVHKLVGHDNAVVCMTYSPDGKTIATGGVDKTIRFWDADTFKPLKKLVGHTHWVESLVYTADGKTLISSSHDHTVRFWDVEKGIEKDGQITLPGSVRTAQLTPDEKSLIVGGGPKLLKVFELPGRTEVITLWGGGPIAVKIQPGEVPGFLLKEPGGEVAMIMPPKAEMDDLPVTVPSRSGSGIWLMTALCLGLTLTMALVAGLCLRYRRRL